MCAPKGVDAVAPNSAIRQFDVLDQHCRSYFCDDSFVCNRGSGTWRHLVARWDSRLSVAGHQRFPENVSFGSCAAALSR